LRRRTADLVDGEGAGDAAPPFGLVRPGGGDVVGDVHDAHVHAFAAQPVRGGAEVEPVPGVVAERQDEPGPAVRGAGDPVDLFGRGGGEHVAEDGAVGEADPGHARVRRVVAGAAADDEA